MRPVLGVRGETKLRAAADAVALTGGGLLATLLAIEAARRYGFTGLAAPLAVGVAILLLRWPALVVLGTVALAVLFEGPDFGLLPATDNLYRDLAGGVMPIDLLFALGVVATALQLLRRRLPVLLPPPPLSLAVALILIALAGGAIVARPAGVSPTTALLASHTIVYVALLPVLIVNLYLTGRQIKLALVGVAVLAIVKAVLGLAVIATGRGFAVEGSTLTYYTPTGNWVPMVVALVVVAALLLRVRPRLPLWLLAGTPLLLASLTLSYRRSFWIGFALALLTLIPLGLRPPTRRLILPIAVLLGVAVWVLGSAALQADTMVAQRLQSLSISRLESNPQDRYRLDERANVVGELRDHPITGLGLEVPWQATERPLPVEVNPSHSYVHFAVLYWWLKLGLLGLVAFVTTMASGIWLSWRIFRRGREPVIRAVGLGSACAILGLLAIESTATFTGVDFRFTIAFAAQLGLLAVLYRRATTAAPGTGGPPVAGGSA